ncbi:hypothetical protein [Salinigranum rubrum]|nr:hypothetical protein [Salinigranum rubrum]
MVDSGQPFVHVADLLGVSLASVSEALSYCAHIDELREFGRENAAAFDLPVDATSSLEC